MSHGSSLSQSSWGDTAQYLQLGFAGGGNSKRARWGNMNLFCLLLSVQSFAWRAFVRLSREAARLRALGLQLVVASFGATNWTVAGSSDNWANNASPDDVCRWSNQAGVNSFGPFSDDLRDLTVDDRGIFFNVIGKL